MDDLQALMDRTRSLQAQVTALQEKVQHLQVELTAHGDLLAQRLRQRHAAEAPVVVDAKMNGAAHEAESNGERRLRPRRRGHPVPVLIAESDNTAAPLHGWVVDRSPEGLRITTERPAGVGTRLRVCPTEREPGHRWFDVEVRNCRAENKAWILGCQFTRSLSWKDLLLFS